MKPDDFIRFNATVPFPCFVAGMTNEPGDKDFLQVFRVKKNLSLFGFRVAGFPFDKSNPQAPECNGWIGLGGTMLKPLVRKLKGHIDQDIVIAGNDYLSDKLLLRVSELTTGPEPLMGIGLQENTKIVSREATKRHMKTSLTVFLTLPQAEMLATLLELDFKMPEHPELVLGHFAPNGKKMPQSESFANPENFRKIKAHFLA